ncbi:hypothetical protein [Nocardioides rubriscoriae]|uniref:hypothetical protein n=1 Tax=Nocardioides rubriscoriae TaxID=642762 RepID=UPI0011DF70BC|nr:hypothetical protein [Nocardioides rubriscoriae]
MSDTTQPRPPQATFCGGTLVVGSALVILLAFSRMSSLGTIEAQEQAQLFADSVGKGVGLDADEWQSVLRVLCMVAAGLAVVTGYLGWRVLQRDRTARLALSVLAPVGLVAGIAVADFVPAIMAVAVLLLWRPPTRQWLDGVAVSEHPALAGMRAGPVQAPAPGASSAPFAPAYPAYPAYPAHPYQPVASWAHGAQQRPGGVVAAALVTVASSTLVALLLGIGLLVVLGDRARFERQIADEIASQQAYRDAGLDAGVLTDVMVVAMAVLVVWALASIVLAVLTLRGSNAARITLVVSAIGAALVSLVGVLAVLPLAITAACVTVAVLLLRRDVAAWFTTRRPGSPADRP